MEMVDVIKAVIKGVRAKLPPCRPEALGLIFSTVMGKETSPIPDGFRHLRHPN